MSYLTQRCRRSLSRLADDRQWCQASTIILVMCAVSGVTITAIALILHLAGSA